MDSKELQHIRELLRRHQRRLYGLELKEAQQGINTPVEILIEIEDLREKIKRCESQLDDFQNLGQTAPRLNPSQINGVSKTGRKQIEVTINGSLDDLTPEIQNALIRAIAGIVEIPPDQVTLLNVRAGSMIFVLELPAEAADSFLKLYESGDEIIRELGIVKVGLVSEKELPPYKLAENAVVNEKAIQQLTIEDLARKGAQEMDLYFAHQDYDPRYDFELFRRAIQNEDEQALEAVRNQYQPLLARWVDRWLNRHPDYSLSNAETEDFVAQAFERFWIAFTPAKLDKAQSLAAVLNFLQMCVNGALTDSWRKLRRHQNEQERLVEELESPKLASTPEDILQKDEFWQLIKQKSKDIKEYTVIYASFSLALSPGEILAKYPELFSSTKEIYQHKANLLERLERDREFRDYMINKKDT